MNKQIVVYTYKGIGLSNGNEWTTDSFHNNVDTSLNHHADKKKSIYCMIPFIYNSRKCKLIYSDRKQKTHFGGGGWRKG